MTTFPDDQRYRPVWATELASQVFVNDIETTFSFVQTVEPEVDPSITAIYIDLPTEATTASSLEVKFTGFANPGFVSSLNVQGLLAVQVLGPSLGQT